MTNRLVNSETPTAQPSSVADCYKANAVFKFINLYCECGWILTCWDTHLECSNPSCNLYQKKFKVPSVELEAL